MSNFCVAYKNQFTTQWAQRTGNLQKGWVRISAWVSWVEVTRIFKTSQKDFSTSDVAIFSNNEWDKLSTNQVQS